MALRPSNHAFRTGFRQSAINRIAGSPNGNDKLALIPDKFIRGFSYSEVADRIVESIVSISVDDAKTTFAKPAPAAMAALLAVTPGAKPESAYAEMCALLGERYTEDAVWAVDNDKSPADVMAARNVGSDGFRTVLDGGWTAETIKEYGVGVVRALPRDGATVAASGLNAKTLRAWIKVSTGLSIRHIFALAATDVSPETLREHTKGLGMHGDHIVAVARVGVARVQALREFRGSTGVGYSFLWSRIDTPEFADAILSLWSTDQIDEEREGKTVNSDRLRALLDAGITPAQIGDANRAGVPFGDWTPELFATDLWEAGRAHREACDTKARAWWVEDGCQGMLNGLWPWTAETYADRTPLDPAPSRRQCGVEGCFRSCQALGLCEGHARRLRTTGHVGPAEFRGRRPRTVCSVDGCVRANGVGDLCMGHYRRLWDTGSVGSPTFRSTPVRAGCSVPGCDRPHCANGLCRGHYWRLRTTGQVGPATFAPRRRSRSADSRRENHDGADEQGEKNHPAAP